ncbi:helix-turn-helix domain-containing protein [Sphingobacterium sp. 1.A.4]|uniref:helix-turn-helix domain-containing protein n=1 Tax=Sphingobacterium sp. 1.A.4 TaxID=2044603 RepID=UPI000C0C09CC|nr:AraC family transcriptional regulator [Sphingobacterium sp. 1.A.4]
MLYLAGIIISLFLLLLIFTKKGLIKTDILLGTWIIIAFLNLSAHYMFIHQLYINYPKVLIFSFTLPILHPLLLFSYIKENFGIKAVLWQNLAYLLPFIAANLIFIDAYLVDHGEAVRIIEQEGKGYEWQIKVNYILIIFSGAFFISKSFLLIGRTKKIAGLYEAPNLEFVQKIFWCRNLCIWISGIWILALTPLPEEYIYITFMLFLIWLGFTGIRNFLFTNPKVSDQGIYMVKEGLEALEIPEKKEIRYKKSSLHPEQANEIHERMTTFLQNEKPFKDSALSLDTLSELLEVHPNYLSEVINSMENKNFNEYINEMRIEEFISLATDPKNQRFTYLSIAYDCGFNSKASFHRNFKKIKGVTPKEFLDKMYQKNSIPQ